MIRYIMEGTGGEQMRLNINILAGIAAVILIIAAVILLFQQPWEESRKSYDKDGSKEVIIELEFGHDMPENSAQHEIANKFADIINHKSSGRVKITVFPSQQLGTDQQMIEAAMSGELAIILTPTAKLSSIAPAFQYVDLPYLFPSRQDVYEMLDGRPGKILLEKLKSHGLIGVTFWESGFKQFTANRPIRSPEDFKGLNIRTMKSRIIMDQFRAFGANPIPIDFHRTYQALKDGDLDGEENSLVSIVNMKFHEVQSHVTISNHAYLGYVFAFSEKIFNTLPHDIQDMLVTTARELTISQRKESIENEKAFIQTIKDAGVNIYYLNDEESKLFKEATKHIIEINRDIIGAEILDETFQYIQQKYKTEREDEIVIGLDADMTLGSARSGLSIKRGMELAVNEINQNGGLIGKKLTVMVRDNGGISARGIANMKYFSKVKNLVAVMGGLHSPVALSELDIIHKEKIIYLDPWAAATHIVDNGHDPNYVFRVSVRDEYAGIYLVSQALEKYKKVALLLENTGWGRSNQEGMTNALAEHKMTPVAVEWFNWGEKNMSLHLERIENSGADVILLVANAPEGSTVIKEMAKRTNKIPVISHWGITGGYFWENVNRDLESVNLMFLQTFTFMNSQKEMTQKVLKKYFEEYNVDSPSEIISPVGTAHAYDLVHLLAIAIKKANSTDRPAIRNALEQIKFYHGLVREYSPPFSPGRHDALDQSDFIMAAYNRNGYIVPITIEPYLH